MIELMWEIVCTVGTIAEFEHNPILRVTDLLGVSSRERIAPRRRITVARGGEAQ